jgi:hypothetical protein
MQRALLIALASLLAGCAVRVNGPSALARSTCAPRNDAVNKAGEFVVCMNTR